MNFADSKINKLVVVTDAHVVVPNANVAGRAGKGKAACGALFLNGCKELSAKIDEICTYLGEMTVPEAEYSAVKFALDHASNLCRNKLEVWSDSELIVNHLTGKYRLKADNLKPLFDAIRILEHRFEQVEYFHHTRENVMAKAADKLAELCWKAAQT